MLRSRKDELVDAAFGDAEQVQSLLRKGVSPNTRNPRGTTPLYGAAVQGDDEIARLLLEAGADPNLESKGEGEGLPLCAAASWGFVQVVRDLLAHGADPNLAEDDGKGLTPLGWALKPRWEGTVRALLDAGADPNCGGRAEPPLVTASSRGAAEVVRALLAEGADPDTSAEDGTTALIAAADRGSLEIALALVEHGASPASRDTTGRTALEAAQAWIGKDITAELRQQAEQFAAQPSIPDGSRVSVCKHYLPYDLTLITASVVVPPDNCWFSVEREDGHELIAALVLRLGRL